MGKKPEVRSAKRPAGKARKPAKEKTQRERFIKAAREVGVDETGREFDRALERIVPPKKKATG